VPRRKPSASADRSPDRETTWSPPVPKFEEEPWRSQRRMTPEEVAPYLAELKAKLASVGNGPARAIDPDLEARYLAACAARKRKPVEEEVPL
jgi:hypothetical protein